MRHVFMRISKKFISHNPTDTSHLWGATETPSVLGKHTYVTHCMDEYLFFAIGLHLSVACFFNHMVMSVAIRAGVPI